MHKDETADTTLIIIACSVGGLVIAIALIVALVLCLKRKSRSSPKNSPEHMDENHTYGTYAYGDDPAGDDYITVEDTNAYYGSY